MAEKAGRLVLSIGMPRAGSGWHYNLVHDLVVAAGGSPAREIRRQFFLQRFLTEVNCNIGHLRLHRLLPVLAPVLIGKSFAVKGHAGPTPTALALIRRGWIIPTYIYRDPRAALLSAYEYGQRGLASGRSNTFSHLTSLEKAADFMLQYVQISEAWLSCPQVLVVRYERLLDSYEAEAKRLVRFLGMDRGDGDVKKEQIQLILEKYRPERGEAGQKGIHFSQGKAERFRAVFTPEQMNAFNQLFRAYLEKLEYTL